MASAFGIDTTALLQLLKSKMSYLQASGLETSRNIAQADIPGARRRELRPFEQVLKKTKEGVEVAITSSDLVKTGEQIHREEETLTMTNIAMEYQGLIAIYKRYHDMIKMVIGKG